MQAVAAEVPEIQLLEAVQTVGQLVDLEAVEAAVQEITEQLVLIMELEAEQVVHLAHGLAELVSRE